MVTDTVLRDMTIPLHQNRFLLMLRTPCSMRLTKQENENPLSQTGPKRIATKISTHVQIIAHGHEWHTVDMTTVLAHKR